LPGGGYLTSVRIDQVQQDLPLFKALLDVQVLTTDGSVTESVWIENPSHTVDIQTMAPPVYLEPDPDVWVLADFEPAPDQFQFMNDEKLPQANFGEHYDVNLMVSGGEPPYALEIIDGAPPAGIQLDTETGRLTGFPLEKGKATFTVQASDARMYPRYARKTFTLKALNPQAELTVTPDQAVYGPGDTMTVTLDLAARTETPVNVQMYIVLELAGGYYFLDAMQPEYPVFTEHPAALPMTIPPEFTLTADILVLPLPDPLPPLSGAWWSLLMNTDSGAAAGPLTSEPFTLTAE